MRILFAAHQFFPEHRAGTEVLTLGLARAMRVRGHEARVFAAKRSVPATDLPAGGVEDYDFEGVPVRRIGRPKESLSRPFRLNYANPDMAGAFSDYLRDFCPEIVHFMHLQGLSADAVPVARASGVPIVYTATDFWAVCPVVDLRRHDGEMCSGPDPGHCLRCLASRQPASRLARLAEHTPAPVLRAADALSRVSRLPKLLPLRQVRDLSERPAYIRERVNSLDRVIAPTRLTRDLLVRNGVRPELVEVSHYGIDTSNVAPSRRGEGSSPDFRFGFIGTLGPHKGCDLLVRAVRSLPRRMDVSLDIYGSDRGFEGFEAKLRRLAGDDVRISFLGTFPPEGIGDVLADMDALIVPSRWYENTPLVVYAAFAAGVPVVATDLGGLSEVVEHEKNGLLFPLEDASELARCLERLAGELGLLGRLRGGIGPVKTIEENAEELLALYNSLVKRGTP
ncbi:MAG: glycosyltransferase family 4 protein [Rubrobacter sp.]|nr:glycosyltransferase family 4 protein [Rubrobacter sp.]